MLEKYGTMFVPDRATIENFMRYDMKSWAIHHIRTYTDDPITIHVAEWNQNAIKLYMKNGFVVTKFV